MFTELYQSYRSVSLHKILYTTYIYNISDFTKFRSKKFTESLDNHSKPLGNAAFRRLEALCLYGALGVSTSSLYRESTDSDTKFSSSLAFASESYM